MNGNWSGGMLLNSMRWGLPPPQYHWSSSFMLPFLPQMPQNLQLPVAGEGLLPGASFPDPGQPQFLPPRPPFVSTAPSFPLGPPSIGPFSPGPPSVASFPSQPPSVDFFPTKPPSATSFQAGPPTSFPARAPSTASTSSFPSGPPSVASFPKAVPRAWLQPKPKMVESVCGDSYGIEELKRPKLSQSDKESPASQASPPRVCRLCAGLVRDELIRRLVFMLVPVPPTFSLTWDQREHADAHSAQFQKRLAEVFPLCFPDAPTLEERDAGSEGQEPLQEPFLPSNSRSAESLPPPPTAPPDSIPTSDPSPTTAPPTSKTPKKEKVGKKGAKLGKRAKGTDSQDSEAAILTSETQSYPSEDQAKVPTTPTTPFLKRENVSGAHICPHCGTSYSTSAFLDKHVHLCRQRPKEFPCLKCSSSFGAKGSLTRHVETVHCPPKHQCHICGKWYSQKSHCTEHMRSQHSNSNPLKCSRCAYSTIRQSDLTRHMSTHTSQKPFACPLCSASFTVTGLLKSHLNKVHSPGQSPFLCPHCGWAFATKCRLSQHINSLHKES